MKKEKKGQTINLVSGSVIAFMALIFTIVIVLFAVSTLSGIGFFDAGSAEETAVNNTLGNFTSGIELFVSNVPTVFLVFGILLIVAVLVLLLLYIRRTQLGSGGGGL